MSGQKLYELITKEGNLIRYEYNGKNSYFYEIDNFIIELYYDDEQGIRVFSKQDLDNSNTFYKLHDLKGFTELELCNKLYRLMDKTEKISYMIKNKLDENENNVAFL